MACITNFLKIICENKNTLTLLRCCTFEPLGEVISVTLSDDILSDSEKLYSLIMDKAYQKPENFYFPPQQKFCNDTCEKLFDRSLPITTIGISIHTCNLACKTCREEVISHVEDETVDLYFYLLDTFRKKDKSLIPNLSGEPFFYKARFREFLKSLEPGDFSSIHITSNMTLLNDTDIKLLEEVNSKIPLDIAASIDSVVEPTFKTLRYPSTSQMFQNALDSTVRLKDMGIPIKVNMTISDLNATQEELDAIGEFSRKHEIPITAVVAFSLNDRYGYLRTDPTVLEFVKKYNVNFKAN